MAFDTAYVVVGWSKSVFYGFAFREDELVVFESAVSAGSGRFWFIYAFVDGRAFDTEAVEQIVSFGVHVGRQRFGGGLAFDGFACQENSQENSRRIIGIV